MTFQARAVRTDQTRTLEQQAPVAKSKPLEPRNSVLVLSGYGIRVAIDRGHLAVTDGVGRERRQGRFHRATDKLRRLVVLGHSGTITLEAMRWLRDVGCAFTQIDEDSEVVTATAPLGLDDPRLRRAQALAATNGAGLDIARDLLDRKLKGQAEVLGQIPESVHTQEKIKQARACLTSAETVDQLRSWEAQAAAAYWQAWAPLLVPWARKDAERVPEHWRTFGARTSPLTASPRSAVNPANALLNYLYAILEAESKIALLSIGLDPGMGVLHADLKARDSLALDLMEAVRPQVDRFVLELLHSHTFAARDFFETRQGVCRVLAPMTHRLAEMTPTWTKAVAPIAEGIARTLLQSPRKSMSRDRNVPTLLTEANRSAGRNTTKRTQRRSGTPSSKLLATCQDCGAVLDDRSRKYCDVCFPERRAEVVANFAKAGPAALAKRRDAGTDPAHTAEARRKQSVRAAENVRANAEWERAHSSATLALDFTKDILPGLQSLALTQIMVATGLSLRYCSLIRSGLKVPHPRHWHALASIGNA
jgi:CRISPR-associated endonuclease Cas1